VNRKINFFEGQIGSKKTTLEDVWSDVHAEQKSRKGKLVD
jgi:hypothetical protein